MIEKQIEVAEQKFANGNLSKNDQAQVKAFIAQLEARRNDLYQMMVGNPMMNNTQVNNLSPLAPGRYAWAYNPGCCGLPVGSYFFNFDKFEDPQKKNIQSGITRIVYLKPMQI